MQIKQEVMAEAVRESQVIYRFQTDELSVSLKKGTVQNIPLLAVELSCAEVQGISAGFLFVGKRPDLALLRDLEEPLTGAGQLDAVKMVLAEHFV